MSRRKASSTIVSIAAIVLVAVVGLWALGAFDGILHDGGDSVRYMDFLGMVEDGTVSSVEIDGDHVRFVADGIAYTTDNPRYDGFERDMLGRGIAVKDASRDVQLFNDVMDVLFNVIFIGLIAFGAIKLIQYSRKTFKVVKHTGVRFDDIAGMDGLKKDMMFLVDVLKNPAGYKGKGIRQVKGVILEGPPGNGKTLFAKALAQEADVRFIATKGADFQSAMMSMGSRKIRMLFSKANRNKPCIVFIDEFDSIGERRNYAGTGIDKENNRIITAMLNEMDGFTANDGLLVIAATNSFASLDPALVRPGRFDLKYHIGNPDYSTRLRLVEIYTKDKRLSDEMTTGSLAAAFDGLSCSAIEAVLNESAAIAMQRGDVGSAGANASGSREITVQDILEAAAKTGSKLAAKPKCQRNM